jgi:hypothetical protein
MMNMRYPLMMVQSSDLYGSVTLDSGNQQGRIARLVHLACGRMYGYFNHAEEPMSNQQKDKQASGGSGVAGKAGGTDAAAGAGMGGDGGQGLRRKEKDDTGGPRGDELSNAVGAAAGGDPGNGSIPPA